MRGEATTLELRLRPSGLRYHLADRVVTGGSTVQLCFSGGWVTGRFEWTGDPTERPHFHCSIELEGGAVAEHRLELPEGALVRWPAD